MKLHEYQSKQIFAKFGIPIPRGRVARVAGEAKQIAEELGGRVVVKSQVLVGGRGKAGGIRLAKSADEASQLTNQILNMKIKGLPVRLVLVEEAVNITKEIYLGIINDRHAHHPVLIASGSGGIDIEDVARMSPERIIRIDIDPMLGLMDYQIRELMIGIDLPREHWREFLTICRALWKVFRDNDATLAEINPLVISGDGRLTALDGKMAIDDNALFRHPDLADKRDHDAEAPAETEARKYGLIYVKMDGEIGCMVNGAGLGMATNDVIKLHGGEPANFLDIGGGASSERVAAAMRIILSDPNVRVVLINIFGGITRCDEVARGLLAAMEEVKLQVPMVVRLVGTNADEGMELLKNAEMVTATTLMDAARKAVAVVREEANEYPN